MWLLYYVKNHVSSIYGGDGYERYGGYIYIYIYMYTSFSYNDDIKNCTLLYDGPQYGKY